MQNMYMTTKMAMIKGTPIPTTQPMTMLRFFLESPWCDVFLFDSPAEFDGS